MTRGINNKTVNIPLIFMKRKSGSLTIHLFSRKRNGREKSFYVYNKEEKTFLIPYRRRINKNCDQ